MLDYISGSIAELTPTYAVLDNHGLGYMLNISLNTYDQLARSGQGGQGRLYVYEAIREDAHVLFGFMDKAEREMFLLLIGVSGVGPNTARMILSSVTVAQLQEAIATENVRVLKAVKGIGSKTAQRIIVDLKDKIKTAGITLIEEKGGASGAIHDEALAALVMLGFTQQASQKALKRLFEQQPPATVEEAIKQALKLM